MSEKSPLILPSLNLFIIHTILSNIFSELFHHTISCVFLRLIFSRNRPIWVLWFCAISHGDRHVICQFKFNRPEIGGNLLLQIPIESNLALFPLIDKMIEDRNVHLTIILIGAIYRSRKLCDSLFKGIFISLRNLRIDLFYLTGFEYQVAVSSAKESSILINRTKGQVLFQFLP